MNRHHSFTHCAGTQLTQVLIEDATPTGPSSKRTEPEMIRRKEDAAKRLKLADVLRPLQKKALRFLQECGSGDSIIIMPTGSGKTTLVWSHSDTMQCSVVFAPFRILVEQLTVELNGKGLAFAWPFSEDGPSLFQIMATAHYIVMPYEAAPTAAGLLAELARMSRLGLVWVDEIHNLCTKGRFRQSLDSVWDLRAKLALQKVPATFVGLTATLRPSDVSDVMKRISVENCAVFRESCFRQGLKFQFEHGLKLEKDAVGRAARLALDSAKRGERPLVFASTVALCLQIAEEVRVAFHGTVVVVYSSKKGVTM